MTDDLTNRDDISPYIKTAVRAARLPVNMAYCPVGYLLEDHSGKHSIIITDVYEDTAGARTAYVDLRNRLEQRS